MGIVNEQPSPPSLLGQALLDAIRQAVREEIQSLKAELNGNRHSTSKREWLKAEELAAEYGLPKTWFEERGRAGDIARAFSGPIRPRFRADSSHSFRCKPATVPEHSGHPFLRVA